MKVLISSPFTMMKIGILAAAVVVATFGLAQRPSAESASGTQIIFSYSSVSPIPAPAIILTPGGSARNIYIWATGVKNTTGVSGFNLAIQYDASTLSATPPFSGDRDGIGDKTWLQSSGRQGACLPDLFPEPGQIIGQCSTIAPPPPLGPTGNGLLGQVLLIPNSEMGAASQLVLVEPEVCPPSCVGVQGTFMVDTPIDPEDNQRIPAPLIDSTIIFLGCADNSPPPDGDGIVDLPNDILGVILRFQMTSAHPDWSELFDLNSDGLIDLPNDILGTILQFQLPCTQSA